MCELFCLSSRNPTVATFSLRAFAARGQPGIGPVDGWGLAFCDGRDVRIYKEPEPAANSEWLSFIEARHQPSRLVISHIRHATQGTISLENTQPFTRELAGRMHVFAHNGHMPAIESRRATLAHYRPIGETDSEIAFCELLERMSCLWTSTDVPPLENRLAVVKAFAAELRELGPANFLYADGDAWFAHGHRRTQGKGVIAPPGLWRLERQCECDRDALARSGIQIDLACGPQQILLLASVPLTDEPWQPLAEGEVIAGRAGLVLLSSRDPLHVAAVHA